MMFFGQIVVLHVILWKQEFPLGNWTSYSMSVCIDPEIKRNTYGKGKYILRRAFAEDHLLPEEIIWREKAAFSDAVGHSMVDDLKEYADNFYTEEEFVDKCQRYIHAKRFYKGIIALPGNF